MRDNYLTPVLIVSSLSTYYVAKHLLLQLLTFLGAEGPLQIICSHKIRYSEGYSLAVCSSMKNMCSELRSGHMFVIEDFY